MNISGLEFVINVECARYRWHFYLKWTRKIENKGRFLSYSLHRIAWNALLFISLPFPIKNWFLVMASYFFNALFWAIWIHSNIYDLQFCVEAGSMFSLYLVFHVYHCNFDLFMWPCTCKSLDPDNKNQFELKMSFIIW